MEKILFIAYQFPPQGGPGVQRSSQLVRHLRENGFDPVVLTIKQEDIERAGYVMDTSLLGQLPPDLYIVRTPSYEPITFIRIMMNFRLYRAAWFCFYPFLWEWSARWPRKTFSIAMKLIREHDIKLIYTSSGPFSTMLLGRALKRKLGVRWVADLRDPFTDAYAWKFPSKLHWLLMKRFEKKLFSLPDRLVVNTPAVKRLYESRKIIAPSKLICITNGF